MKNLLKLILAAVFLIGAVPADTIIQESIAQETTRQCCEITLADAGDIKKKKKKKRRWKKAKRRKRDSFQNLKVLSNIA